MRAGRTGGLACGLVMLLAACSAVQAQKPLVSVKGSKYKTLLSLDGDPFRPYMGAILLVAVEEVIKQTIINKKLAPYNDTNDFDIVLSDYFDLIAGSSGGGYTASYLATWGGELVNKYNTTLRPGTVGGALEMWGNLAAIYQDVAWNSSYAYQEELGNRFSTFLQNIYPNITTHSFSVFKTGALWTWTDLGDMTALYNFVDPVAKKAGFVRLAETSEPDEYLPDADYDLWTVTRGSGAFMPVISPIEAKTTASTPATSQQTLVIGDGGIGAIFPGVIAVPHLILYDNVPASHIAVLSLGSSSFAPMLGHSDFLDAMVKAPNAWQLGWNTSVLGTRVAPVQMIESTLGSAADGRFVRLDEQFENGTACLNVNATDCAQWKQAIVESSLTPNNIEAFMRIALELVQDYHRVLEKWVEQWLF